MPTHSEWQTRPTTQELGWLREWKQRQSADRLALPSAQYQSIGDRLLQPPTVAANNPTVYYHKNELALLWAEYPPTKEPLCNLR